ncbi:MAG: GUN4 domain-containing protein [Leptolyngbyaceae cyanobacterium MO_188.B28]|nr:GUN4 domain-containing protein [Leptolyngbyaceae cyanobacterium MO_188.B28]
MSEFDVFLAHNSQDKPQVKVIARELKRRGLKPWLDVEQIPPGRAFQDVIQEVIPNIKTAAIFIGPKGLGKWQVMELRTITSRCVEEDIPVIPILLPGVEGIPDNLIFLRQFHWVNFTDGLEDADALYQLEWGITGERPQRSEPQPEPATETRVAVPPPPKPDPTVNDLRSEKGVDYTKLRDLLKAGKWKEADSETYLVMLKVVGRQEGDYIREKELLNFPCTDLRTIDQLWIKYSKGRFGFSAQKEIYLDCGGKPDGKYYEEAWEKFCDRVGWKEKGKWFVLVFDTSSPEGHLPRLWRADLGEWISSLASRLVNCSAIRSVEMSRNTQE